MLRALDRKLLRDIRSMKGQVTAIAMVAAAGVATYVLSKSTLDSLESAQARMYREFRFADIFGSLKRAPAGLLERIAAVPGVQWAEARVAAPATIEAPGYDGPVSAQILSLPEASRSNLNLLQVKAGRLPEPDRDREAMVSDAFAEAHRLRPGATLRATINGRRRTLEITGIANSPEFVYQLQPGSIIPDFKGYAILWMNRAPLEAAFDMRGAFNQYSVRMEPSGNDPDIIRAIDGILEAYGGLGAYGRKDQVSHRYLSEEFRQLRQMAKMFPVIFLSVTAFLLNVVMTRLMATQRGQIAILRGFGYSTGSIAAHFLKLAAVVVILGAAAGLAAGAWMGRGMLSMYLEFYRFPYLDYQLRPAVAGAAVLFSGAAAIIGTAAAVVRAAQEPPAAAMQPAPPASYRPTFIERAGLGARLSPPAKIILRNLERKPVKSILSALGIALSVGILVVGGFWRDAVDFMVFAQFKRAQRDDISVTFTEPVSRAALHSLTSLDGVRHAEGTRSVAARLRFEQHSYRAGIQGLEPEGGLRRLLDRDLRVIELPEEGLVLTDYLAELLHVRPGDTLTVEVLEGSRPARQVPVAGVVSEYVGVAAYMRRDALNRLMREGDVITGAWMAADMERATSIFAKLKEMPVVAATAARGRMLESFYETMARQMLTFAFFNTILATTIAVGVVYNTARVALSERARELASLRVLGYTRAEVSFILVGEMAVLVMIALPAGLLAGRALVSVMAAGMRTDLFRVPVVISPFTYAFAATVVMGASILSAAVVRRKIDHLDLVEVLKTRE